MTGDAYFTEEGYGEDEGYIREFWVRSGPGLRQTLEFQDNGQGVTLVWNTDAEYGNPEYETRSSMDITVSDVRHMISTLQSLIADPS